VNGKRVAECVLSLGDLIQLGQVALRVCGADEPGTPQAGAEHRASVRQTELINACVSAAAEIGPTALEESKLRADLAAMYSLGAALGLCSARSDAMHLLLDWMHEWLRVDQAAVVFQIENRLQVKACRKGQDLPTPRSIDWSTVKASLERQTLVARELPALGQECGNGTTAEPHRALAVWIPETDAPGAIYAEWVRSDSVWDQRCRELLQAAARVLGESLDRLREGKPRPECDPASSWIANISHDILVGGPAMQSVRDFIRRAAAVDDTVLIMGETGTGKELVAREIHRQSARAARPFIARNCSAFPESLLEDELFGHEPGAFTGATKLRKGVFDQANSGTLLLDEIAESPHGVQSELLRVLEDRTFYRVGGQASVQVDVRIIASTNRDLAQAVAMDKFRRDLYYRLEVLTIHLPSLRERREDLGLLAQHFVELACKRAGLPIVKLSPAALRKLESHDWPGNVRELRNTLQRSVVFSEGAMITPEHIMLVPSPTAGSDDPPADGRLEEVERAHILHTLARTGGNKAKAAALLGISRNTLLRKFQRFGHSEDAER
jgi:DNA-binding NtrC family response regulator